MAKALSVAEAAEAISSGDGFRVNDDGCWIWEDRSSTGYGPYLSFWRASSGRAPDPLMELHHSCFEGPAGCVNPDHIVEITPEEHLSAHRRLTDKDRETWSRQLRAERTVRGWSLARMATELGVTAPTVRSWERADTAPEMTLRRIIAHKFGWSPEPRKWVVTYVHQEVVVARSSAEAVERINLALKADGKHRKTEIVETRAV